MTSSKKQYNKFLFMEFFGLDLKITFEIGNNIQLAIYDHLPNNNITIIKVKQFSYITKI